MDSHVPQGTLCAFAFVSFVYSVSKMSSCKLIIYHHFAAEILNTEYTDIYCQEIYTEYLKGTKEFTEGSLHYPLVGFLNYAYLSVKQIVTKVFAELVTPVPRKTIAF